MNLVKKKLLVYAHYYYPDVASTGQILRELCEGMSETFKITVICVVPSYNGKVEKNYRNRKHYKEVIGGINIIRVRVPEFSKENKKSRIVNLLTYFFRAIKVTFQIEKQDYIFSVSQPPILGGILGVIGKVFKGGKFIYNIQDFNPEQIMAVKYAKNRFVIKAAMIADKLSCLLSDKVIVVGRDMQETFQKRFTTNNVPVNTFINNWIDEEKIFPLPENHSKVIAFKKKYDLEDKFVIMYSGNIGLYYDLENLIKVMGKFKSNEEIVFAFVGDGSKKRELEDYVNENRLFNIRFIPYQKKEDLIYSLNAANVHWVVNAKGIKGISVPSKLYGVMAVGKPALGVLETGSEAQIILEQNDCGYVVEPGEYDKLEELIRMIIKDGKKNEIKGKNARKYLEENLTKGISVQKYINEILSC